MALEQPPTALQNVPLPAEELRRFISSAMGHRQGVVGLNDFVVSQMPTPGMGVDITTGTAFVKGVESTYQGLYHGENRGTLTVVIDAADASNPRYDRVVLKVKDSAYSGALDTLAVDVIKGTPAGTPTEPTVTGSYLELARVLVGAGVTSITNANILDRRVVSGKGRASALGGIIVTTSATLPTTDLYEGLFVYCTDTDLLLRYNGSAWTGAAGVGTMQPLFFAGGIAAGGATTFTSIHANQEQNNLGAAPFPLTMVVKCFGDIGANSVANQDAAVQITDQSGNTIIAGEAISAGSIQFITNQADERRSSSMMGRKDYTAGQVMGFRVRYKVNTGTIYIGCHTEVSFYPKLS